MVSFLLGILQAGAGVELEKDDVAILHGVVASLLTVLASRLGCHFAALGLEVLEVHHFGHNETLLEIRVNASGGLWRLGALKNGPGLDLIWSGREEVFQLQCLVAGHNDLVQHALAFRFRLEGLALQIVLLAQLLLEGTREGDEQCTRVVFVDPLLDLGQPLVLLANEVLVRQIHQVDDRLGGQEQILVQCLDLQHRNGITN